MQPSMFNLRVPLAGARRSVSDEHADRRAAAWCRATSPPCSTARRDQSIGRRTPSDEERDALELLADNGFLVDEPRRRSPERSMRYLAAVKSDTSELNVTLLTTLQCNFACDYCFQGDHGDYNMHADKMSLETAERVADWIERELDRVAPGETRADVLRRRAAAQPAGDVHARRAGCGTRRRRAASRSSSTSSPTACC